MINLPAEIMTNNWILISDDEFKKLTQLVYNTIGIHLSNEKRTLVMGRLQKLLREKKIASFEDYYKFVISDKTGDALSELANFISTNHTFFYREKDHFEFFITHTLPFIEETLRTVNSNDIRIWSAGCSSGEEPYTLIMLMLEYFGSKYDLLNAGILATDISERMLNKAKIGLYNDEHLKSLPEIFKKKYFQKLDSGDYQIIDKVKNEATFRRFNLMNKEFNFKKQFHTIFCRNVMIYFDDPTREQLINKIYNSLAPKGFLFIGHSETIKKPKSMFKFVQPAVYQKI